MFILLPKTPDATTIMDYQLISLIHVLGKLFSKVLANRMVPRLGSLCMPTRVPSSRFDSSRII
jgi:hypothetical protein